ncbi:MAG: polysaccharide deacetylase family protein [Bacillota bacterium]|jgi:peptidoglycan/xylan/chitin deacetylase (PgdA/CDA1 family)
MRNKKRRSNREWVEKRKRSGRKKLTIGLSAASVLAVMCCFIIVAAAAPPPETAKAPTEPAAVKAAETEAETETAPAQPAAKPEPPAEKATEPVDLPVLMYHHLDTVSNYGTVVSEEVFRRQMEAVRDAGYHAVGVDQLIAFVDDSAPLPEKPVLITFDDGYASNLKIGAPILKETGLKATIFVIGRDEADYYYGDTESYFLEHFTYDLAQPWVNLGVLDVQCHSYDMHHALRYGGTGRDGMLRQEGESEEDYRAAIAADLKSFSVRRDRCVFPPLTALAFPYGYYNDELDQVLADCGIRLTFTIENRVNRLEPGNPGCLRKMGRINVVDRCGPETLLNLMARPGSVSGS